MTHPFRFIAPMPPLEQPITAWVERLHRIEDLGFSTIAVSDHLGGGWAMEPIAALAAAAAMTSRIRLLSLVLINDLRNPVVLHKAAATIDVLSNGRLELGLGAGWLLDDYRSAGIPFDAASVRIDRLAEAIAVIRGLFGPDPLTFQGAHYRVVGLDGLPKPVQEQGPPIVIGGGGRCILELAAREADIVSVHSRLSAGVLDSRATAELTAERCKEKVDWLRARFPAYGRDPDEVELQFSVYRVCVAGSRSTQASTVSLWARMLDMTEELARTSPASLVGDVEECVDLLVERRERYGFSYLKLGPDVEAVAPIVARLAGR